MSVRDSIVRSIVRQFGHPRGPAGYIVGWVLATRSSNRERNKWVIALLGIEPHDRVLEIGFGPGLAIREASRLATEGVVCGVDHSALMVRQAAGRHAEAVKSGRVDLQLGSAERLPDFGVTFDKIFAVNSVGFWHEPVTRLRELRRLLRHEGLIAIASQPRGPRATDDWSTSAAAEISAQLIEAGFSDVRHETLSLKPAVICVIGTNVRP